MSVAAAVPRSQPLHLMDSTLVWARSAAFASSQAISSVSPSLSPTHYCSAGVTVAPAVMPGYLADGTLCDAVSHGDNVDTDAAPPYMGSCPMTCNQVPFVGRHDLARGQSGPSRCVCQSLSPSRADNSRHHHGNHDGPHEEGYKQEGAVSFLACRQAHLYASTSHATAAAVASQYSVERRRQSFTAAPWGPADASPPSPVTRVAAVSGMPSRGSSGGGAITTAYSVPAMVPLQGPSSPSPLPIPLSSNCGRYSGGGAATATAPRRPAYGVKASAMTSQISAAQRTRAATFIQAAWRGFRIRRLYLRLIVWRLRPPARQNNTYCGIREFPPIPDLPEISLFTQYGRPYRFRTVKRRVWFGMEGPFCGAQGSASISHSTNHAQPSAQNQHQLQQYQHQPQQPQQPQRHPQQQQQQQQPQPKQVAQGTIEDSDSAILQPLTPHARWPAPRAPLRLVVPARAEADVPMSEVERILAGGFWRVDEPRVGPAAHGAAESETGPGGGGEGAEGLSMYMRARMRQEEREAEEALQMLSYEPHDLMHKLGSLKERTLERLGSLGRTIGETLSSGLLLGQRGHAHGQTLGSHPQHQPHEHGLWHWHWHWHSWSQHQPQPNPEIQARSAPRMSALGGSGGSRPKLSCGAPGAAPHPYACGSSSGGGSGSGDHEWTLHMPLLTVVDAQGRYHHTELPVDGVAIPLAVNWQRYRNRSHVSRMSF